MRPPRWFVVLCGSGLTLIGLVGAAGAVDVWVRNRRWRRPEARR